MSPNLEMFNTNDLFNTINEGYVYKAIVYSFQDLRYYTWWLTKTSLYQLKTRLPIQESYIRFWETWPFFAVPENEKQGIVKAMLPSFTFWTTTLITISSLWRQQNICATKFSNPHSLPYNFHRPGGSKHAWLSCDFSKCFNRSYPIALTMLLQMNLVTFCVQRYTFHITKSEWLPRRYS